VKKKEKVDIDCRFWYAQQGKRGGGDQAGLSAVIAFTPMAKQWKGKEPGKAEAHPLMTLRRAWERSLDCLEF